MEELVFKHSIPVQLRFNDVDGLGHVNNSVYFNFYDLGKTGYFDAVYGHQVPQEKIDIVIAHAEVDFIEPVFLKDEILVQTTVTAIGNKSLTMLQRIICAKTRRIKCLCKTIMVGFDFKTNTSKVISSAWRDAISKYEGRNY